MSFAVSAGDKVFGNDLPQPLEGDGCSVFVSDGIGELGMEVLIQFHDPWKKVQATLQSRVFQHESGQGVEFTRGISQVGIGEDSHG